VETTYRTYMDEVLGDIVEGSEDDILRAAISIEY
jgi:hypothetical protein